MKDEDAEKIQKYLPQGGCDPPRYDIHRDLERLLAERAILREALNELGQVERPLTEMSLIYDALRKADEA